MDRLAAGVMSVVVHARQGEGSARNKRVLPYRYVAFKETVNAVADDILRDYALCAVAPRPPTPSPCFFVSRETPLCTD